MSIILPAAETTESIADLGLLKIEELNEQAWSIRYNNTPEAQSLAMKAYELAGRSGDLSGQALALRTLSFCCTTTNDYKNALLYGLQSIEMLEELKDYHNLAYAARTVSQIHWDIGDYSTALDFNLRSLSLAQEVGNRHLEAHAYNNTAMNYSNLGDIDKEGEMLLRAIELFEELDDLRGLILASNNMAMHQVAKESYEEALIEAEKAWELAKRSEMVDLKANVLDTLGQIYTKLGRLDEARDKLMQARELAQKHELQRVLAYAQLNIARICLQQEKHEDAIEQTSRSLLLAESLDSQQLIFECHQLLADSYSEMGRFDKALEHHRAYHKFHSIVFAEERNRNFANLEVRYRTESAQKEAQIYRQQNRDLESEIAERKRVETALVEAKEKAIVANEAKSKFITNMSHELRTPLNGILGFTQLLLDDSSLDEEQHEGISIIHQSGTHLLTLINDILDISKIEAKKVALEPSDVHLAPFLDGITAMMRMNAESQGLTLKAEIEPELPEIVSVDEKRLRQVIINLLGNAIKFTADGEVSFRVTSGSAVAHRYSVPNEAVHTLRIEVRDTGIGIKPESLKTIFKPFEQVGDEDLQRSGTGLGLAISQELIHAMHGEIQVESEVGEGSRFWFDIALPVRSSSGAQKHERRDIVGYSGKPIRMLIVDDDAINRRILERMLKQVGIEIAQATNGQEAIQMAEEWQPDGILMDIHMPHMQGDEAAEIIRSKQPEIVQLVYSASINQVQNNPRMIEIFDGFVNKPVNRTNLIDTVGAHLALEWEYEVPA